MNNETTIALLRCDRCGQVTQPTAATCTHCFPQDCTLLPVEVEGSGALHSFTQVFVTSKPFEHLAPYWLALVKLRAGPNVLGFMRVPDGKEPQLDQPVRCSGKEGNSYVFELA